ncbi:MAG: hypothetical protein HY789_00575 [Deltaproteobacteria bacterium]|nr:hypothetical protein [Deltaproteobacteria bacterium]
MAKQQKQEVMFWSIILVLFILLTGGTLLHAAEQMGKDEGTKQGEAKKEMDDTMQAIQDYSIDKKEQVMADAKELLDKMDAKIDQLEKQSREKWQQMSEASREKSQETLRELRKKRNEIAEWYGGMKHSSANAWNEVKKGFINSYHSLQDSLDEAPEKF